MQERIKKLRKALGLTQREFGERVGVKPNTIATYEIGRNQPIDAVLSLICREFGVNEAWLRTGAGEMFNTVSETELDGLVKLYGLDDLDRRIVSNYMRLNEADRAAVKRYVRSLVDARQARTEEDGGGDLDDSAIEREVEAYRAQLLASKKAGAGSSASSGMRGA